MALTGEDKIQAEAARLLDAVGLLWFHCPNGEHRRPATGRKLKLMGVKRGVPDVLILTEPRTAIEIKTETGRLSAEQKHWCDALTSEGWGWYLARSVDDVAEIVRKVYGCRPEKKQLDPSLILKRS